MNTIKSIIKGNMRQYGMLFALFAVVILFQYLTKGTLMMPLNISNIIQQNSYVMILACGMLLCILTGGNIDLSVGSIVGFVGAISAVLMLKMNIPTFPAIFLSLLVGVAIGSWHGLWIAYVGVPSFIATLAGLLLFRGLTMVILKGTSLAPLPTDYQFIASGFVPDPFNVEGTNVLTLLAAAAACAVIILMRVSQRRGRQRYGFKVEPFGFFVTKMVLLCLVIGFFGYQLSLYRGMPVVLLLVAVLVIIYSFITNKTVFGRHIYAFGGNAKAAKLSGVNVKRIMFLVYANMGLLSALAGIVFTGRLNSATPKSGNGFELDAIAACFIGGASTTGGIGTIGGAIIGGLLMGVLNNGMAILGVSIDWQQGIKGIVLLIAVAFDILSKKNRAA